MHLLYAAPRIDSMHVVMSQTDCDLPARLKVLL